MAKQTGAQAYVTERFIDSIGAIPMRAITFSSYSVLQDETVANKIIIQPRIAKNGKTLSRGTLNDLSNILSGQELLISLSNLYKEVNEAGISAKAQIICDWCAKNVHPYHITEVFEELLIYKQFKTYTPSEMEASDDPMAELLSSQESPANRGDLLRNQIKKCCGVATFYMDDFIHDLNLIANATDLYCAMCLLYFEHDDTLARQLYRPTSEWDEGVPAFGLASERLVVDENAFRWLATLFPKLTSTLGFDEKNNLLKITYIQNSVFDIAWNSLAELSAATFGQKPYSQKSALRRCSICGDFYIRRYPNQRYCGSEECEKIRNRRKALKHYHESK